MSARRWSAIASATSGTAMLSTWAPRPRNTWPACRTALSTSASTPSKKTVSPNAIRRPLTPRLKSPSTSECGTPIVVSSSKSGPWRAWYTSAASSTDRVSGPTLSSVKLSG
jgi:hypothetical protein